MSTLLDVSELHWLLDIVQSIDVGVVVLDREYRIQVWNSFMENHSGRPASLVIFDIDHFKQLNDTYGHQAGDEVIRQVAALTRGMVRETDYAGRYGGEEFAILLTDTSLEGAALFAERLRQAVERLEIAYDKYLLRCSISLGVACIHGSMTGYPLLIEAADKALYRSKQAGRNRVTLSGAATGH